MAITHQQVKQILQSPELAAVEDAIAARVGLRLIRDLAVTTCSFVEIDAGYTPLTADDIVKRLVADRDLLVDFWVAVHDGQAGSDDDGEFPPGEEPGPGDRSVTAEVLGLQTGTGVKAAVYVYLLRDCPKAAFSAYLKKARTPHAAKYAREVRQAFATASRSPDAR